MIYRPPGTDTQFISSLMNGIIQPALRHDKFLLLGDFNLHLEDTLNAEAQELRQELAAIQMHLQSELHTHKQGHLLDPVFANWDLSGVKSPIPMIWTDHFLVSFKVTIPTSIFR